MERRKPNTSPHAHPIGSHDGYDRLGPFIHPLPLFQCPPPTPSRSSKPRSAAPQGPAMRHQRHGPPLGHITPSPDGTQRRRVPEGRRWCCRRRCSIPHLSRRRLRLLPLRLRGGDGRAGEQHVDAGSQSARWRRIRPCVSVCTSCRLCCTASIPPWGFARHGGVHACVCASGTSGCAPCDE